MIFYLMKRQFRNPQMGLVCSCSNDSNLSVYQNTNPSMHTISEEEETEILVTHSPNAEENHILTSPYSVSCKKQDIVQQRKSKSRYTYNFGPCPSKTRKRSASLNKAFQSQKEDSCRLALVAEETDIHSPTKKNLFIFVKKNSTRSISTHDEDGNAKLSHYESNSTIVSMNSDGTVKTSSICEHNSADDSGLLKLHRSILQMRDGFISQQFNSHSMNDLMQIGHAAHINIKKNISGHHRRCHSDYSDNYRN
jgi:hypothetical protein